MKRTLLIFVILISNQIIAQENKTLINPVLFQKYWTANWITYPSERLYEYGVYHFRKSFDLKSIPDKLIIHVSADNRYILYINGQQVSIGPCKGSLDNWRFETVNINPYLKIGENIIASIVWNFGKYKTLSQQSNMTGFIIQGNSPESEIFNTDGSWQVFKNEAYSPVNPKKFIDDYVAVGPCDSLVSSKYPWGWQEINYDDSNWEKVKVLGHGVGIGGNRNDVCEVKEREYWTLSPRDIPFMEEKILKFEKIARCQNISIDSNFLKGGKVIIIPKNSKVSILFDQGYLTNAYPVIDVSKGKGTTIAITYAEALVKKGNIFHKDNKTGNRNNVDNNIIIGYKDFFLPDGADNRIFKPLDFRTYRYVQLDITTSAEPLIINDFYGIFTAYPFEEKAYFKCNEKIWKTIWDCSWRTLRLCANETYYDNPYFERMQYIGDTRIQCLVSSYVSGDDRLMRKAIKHFDDSRLPNGLTLSRYPTTVLQYMPTWSLFWISMIHDYWMIYNDTAFVKEFLLGIKGVIKWFERHIDQTGMLGPMEGWIFADWSFEKTGMPPGVWDGNSSVVSLQLAYNLFKAAELAKACGQQCDAKYYLDLAEKIKSSAYKLCYDPQKGLLSDTPEKNKFSQHANIFGVLTNIFTEKESAEVLKKIKYDTSLTSCTYYFRFYFIEALKKAGLGDDIFEIMNPWIDAVKLGLTTFPETPEPTRADCQGWSSIPDYVLLSKIAGIEPSEPAFKQVIIKPSLGRLKWIDCKMPTPQGEIKLNINNENKINGEVVLPDNVSGKFIFKNQIIDLKPGINKLILNN